ncbi:hypothetical protein [Bacillus sp. UNC41MFS5]|uniref:hypothetical protein n=1 Tax=Bacillus sp. UNC41MFS5 TaxID=1449046 RepID=UPI0012DBE147|nr:hypothetical protein [Bacillus sp. UNC41MFS5]
MSIVIADILAMLIGEEKRETPAGLLWKPHSRYAPRRRLVTANRTRLKRKSTSENSTAKLKKPLVGVSGFFYAKIKTVNLWALGAYFTYVNINTTGGAINEEGFPNLVRLVVFLVISWFVFYKPSHVYEKEG